MITRIREIRKGKEMTLADVAAACAPPTTPQTIGRLETGTRTVSIDWLNRIAAALGVLPADLVKLDDRPDIPIAARLTGDGAEPLQARKNFAPPQPNTDLVGMEIEYPYGDYRPRDQLWLEKLAPDRFNEAANRDILAPRSAGRYAFGRLVDMFGARLSLLPPQHGARQIILQDVPWIAVVRTLIRAL
ncbi:helix-turn-helix transcriptional regulator [Pacificimonas sp. WHA3]|uniref:Helix-turn-helix transcriptional regulator n=1 Tax=Pacificimonas pallii TaxID=2827236 RepID=A0ABS6SBB4_9SPHN|nr:helix-turn-helix transcriptional regulator [Pacificimonas pallii]MBV7255221.1 helix-turn-helix transcriptional regulator [Pacificimonas pallii]